MRKRQAFTLVEMMVSMALVIFIMVLLSQAFVASMVSFRTLKGIGDMEEKLRTAAAILRRDLAAKHFEAQRRVSDTAFFNSPPTSGYFRLQHASPTMRPSTINPYPANVFEGWDADGIPSTRVTDHALSMTVGSSGTGQQDYFTTDISTLGAGAPTALTSGANTAAAPYQIAGVTYTNQLAEVAYFLRQSQQIPGGPTLYGLYRRQALLLSGTNASSINTATPRQSTLKMQQTNSYAEISCKPEYNAAGQPTGNLYFNGPADITIPQRRFGMNPLSGSPYDTTPNVYGGDGGAYLPSLGGYPALLLPNYPTFAEVNYMAGTPPGYYTPAITYGSLAGSDLLLNDVISFEVKLLLDDLGAKAGTRTRLSGAAMGAGVPLLDPFVDLFDSMVYLKEYAYNNQGQLDPLQPLPVLQSSNPRFANLSLHQVPDPDTGGLTPMPSYDGSVPAVWDSWTKDTVPDPSVPSTNLYNYSGWKPSATTSNSSTTLPLGLDTKGNTTFRILAVQITLRIWDKNTQQTRQMTFVQPM